MKSKRILLPLLLAGMMASMALPASAYEYSFDDGNPYEYTGATSVETVYTADRGERKNEDVSKNAALIPPAFGSPGMDQLNTGEYLTPFLAPGGMAYGTINGGAAVYYPGESGTAPVNVSILPQISTGYTPIINTTAFTEVTRELYYNNGTLGTLSIPAISLNVGIYEGTDSTAMAKGAGHFEESSIWNGNVAFASHNRGSSAYFGKIHTLNVGDTITLNTKLGTRTYAVVSVSKVDETDRTQLASTADNRLTLYTCVINERDYRWCVVAKEVV
ncbi:MAG: class D sortase [Oscillospiraceae bacterium]|nr:class D sortase [Oscillospiraceae bacterium]